MSKTTTTSLLGGVLLAGSVLAGEVAPITTPAPESKFSSDIAVGYHSQYNWRGFDLGNDMVDATVNTAFTCPYTGLDISAGAWYASVKDGGFDELDLYTAASKDLGFATASVGYIFYHFFDSADDAQEVTFGLSKEFYGVETGVTYFWDVETDNGGYLEGSISKSFGPVSTGVAVGYSLEEDGFTHVTSKVSYDYALTDTATLSPYVAYAVELDELEGVYGTDEENEFFAGAVLTVTF
ncbi:hypothetical protein SAMN02745181_2793 [Rubritalea squalenifaciens DSM 18772]|uniref:Uncharacterized protein n=2 Tax=Rubritalea TaxID=361050 RepID=A0A1M6NAF5_9BACT|nr:hypothetical protein [Rubritalea squalenifaciens]SHJ92730.1 hypothetical protein SAMN02745181_2793 [Rubritalea squalenifaciens DSM 18772]